MTTEEFCPDCGRFKPLVPQTGFCLPCTRIQFPRLCVCNECGNTFDSKDNQQRYVCPSCEREKWLKNNADKLEAYMMLGLTFYMAEERVMYENRPTCLCCGQKIKGGQRGRALFCTTTPACRLAVRRYRYYRYMKGRTADEALREVLSQIANAA